MVVIDADECLDAEAVLLGSQMRACSDTRRGSNDAMTLWLWA